MLFFVNLCIAQHPAHYPINTDNGLPSNEVYSLIQDSVGFVWIGSSNGLARFDGRNFKQYANVQQNSRAVSNLRFDIQKNLWCQNFTGQIFCVKNDSLHLVFDRSAVQSNYPVFTFDNQSSVYLTSDLGIEVFKQGRYLFFLKSDSLSKKYFFSDLLFAKGKLHYTNQYQVGYFINRQNHPITNTNRPDIFSDVLQQSFLYEINGRIFLLAHGSKRNSIWEISNDSLIWKITLPENWGRVFALHPDVQGKIWVGAGTGAYAFDKEWNELFNGKALFPGKSISDVLLDKEGNYWFSTLQDGIFVIPDLEVVHYSTENSLMADNRVRCLETDNDNTLFIGYQNGALSRFNLNNHYWQTIAFPNSPKEIQTLCYHKNKNTLLVGQNNTWIADRKNLSVKPILEDINLKSITPISGDTFFLGSVNEGYVAALNNQFIRLQTLRSKRVRVSIYDTSTQTLWVGYSDGLFRYTNQLSQEEEIKFNGNSIYANDFAVGRDGALFIGTVNNGLLVFAKGTWQHEITQAIGVTAGTVRKLALSEKNLWIAGEQWLTRYQLQQKKRELMNRYDGLLSTEISSLKCLNGKLFVATPKGLWSFPEKVSLQNDIKPTVLLQSVAINEKDTLLTSSYTLPYSKNKVQIHFTGLAFKARGDVRFKYRMIGLDTAWQFTTNGSTYVAFASLPAGKFLFEVKAVNEDGTESNTPAKIEFEILKPWWQTWWFYVLVLLVFGGIISLLYSLRIRNIHKKNELEQRYANSKLTALKAQMNPHFMFNALSSIQDLVLQQKNEQAQIYLGKFSDLTRKVLQASGSEFITLQSETEMLSLYLELEALRFEGALEYQISLPENEEELECKIPSMIVQPFVENALKHGLLHRHGQKKLLLTFEVNKDHIKIMIDDNGIGRAASAEIRKRNHQSFSTAATEQRFNLLREYFHLDIDLKITDKFVGETATGTRVEIWINHSHDE
jgi:ligand-binding sensor domain-containing protein